MAPGFDQHCLGAALRVSFYGRRLAGFDRGGHQQPVLGSETVALGASRGDLGQAIVQAPPRRAEMGSRSACAAAICARRSASNAAVGSSDWPIRPRVKKD